MNLRPVFLFVFLVALFSTVAIAGGPDKARYDHQERMPASGADAVPAAAYGSSGWYGKVTRLVGEVAVMSGGYFTIGTTGGTTTGALDDRCGITFGHPFARTSYPVICVDGAWMKPLAFFSADSERVAGGGDSVALSYVMPGVAQLTLTYALSVNGTVCDIRSELRNLDAVAHHFGAGFAFDPGLGVRGDGVLSFNAAPILNDTVITFPGTGAFIIRERSTIPSGLSMALEFPDASPDTVLVANWTDRADLDGPVRPVASVRTLYDLDLFASWGAASVLPGAALTRSIRIRQAPSEFGSGLFLRWDIPDHSEITDGVMFPAKVRTTVTVTNLSGTTKTGTLSFAAGPEITFDTTSRSVTFPGTSTSYSGTSAIMEEMYQETLVRIIAAVREQGGAADSVVRSFLIPATPVTDTGLVVSIDSLVTAAFPVVRAFVTVKREASGQYVTMLAPKNLMITDEGFSVPATSIVRDTSGGATSTDIMFVLDVTGSMGGAIDKVKNSILAFADSMTSRGIAYRFGLVTFLDAVETIYPFTTDAGTFKSYVSAQYAHGGDDAPENSLDALDTTCTMPWDPNARHVIVWITDERYHASDWATPRTRDQVLTRLLEKNITVYAVGAREWQTDWYNPIALPTGGKYYDYLGQYLDILVDIGLSKSSTRMVVTYTAPVTGAAQHGLTIVVRYAGRGGSASATYGGPPGAGVAVGLMNFPNPFNPSTTIRFSGPGLTAAEVVIYDCLGREVQRMQLPPGEGMRDVVWDARDVRGHDVASGVYVVRVQFTSSSGDRLGAAVLKILHVR